MKSFKHFIPTKVIFGWKSVERISTELERLPTQRTLIISGRSAVRNKFVDTVKAQIDGSVELFSKVPTEPEVESVLSAFEQLKDFSPTLIIAIGGGSVIDFAKVLSGLFKNEVNLREILGVPEAFENDTVPLVAIPTTAGSGSEVTQYAVLTDRQKWRKTPVISSKIFPVLAVDDPFLTLTLPQSHTAHSGVDALTHCIEAFLTKRKTPIAKLHALEGIKLVFENLPRAFSNPSDGQAREKVLLGSLFGGMAIADAGAGLIHTLAHVLGAMYSVSHGLANALFLIPVLKFYGLSIKEELREIEGYLKIDGDFLRELEAWLRFLGIPKSIRDVGFKDDEISTFITLVMEKKFLMWSLPRIPSERDIREILESA